MRFSGKLALKVGAVGVAAGAILVPAAAAHAAVPSITVTPNTGLADGDSVTVAGTGYTAGATIAVLECADAPVTASTQCDLSAIATNTATAGTDGTFTKSITVHTGMVGSGTCAAGSSTCAIVAGNEADQTESASSPLTFAAAGPSITVTPNTGLADGDSVTVAGTGYTAGATIAVLECADAPVTASTQCDLSAIATNTATAGTDGTFTKSITVHTGTVGSGTCAVGSSTCAIVAGNEADQTESASEAISFAGPTGPTVTVSPATGVKDGQTVTVHGTGFPASQPTVYALECSGTSGQAACDVGTLDATGHTDASGSFTAHVKVHTGAVGNGTCKAGKTCYIAAATSTTPDATSSGAGAFTFAAGSGSHKPAATKTKAAFSKKKDAIAGVVSSHGKGIKGLKTKLELKKGKHWKTVDSAKTHKHGAFVYKHIKKNGKYEVKTLKTSKYKGSTSKAIKVKV
jgi:hypothetical protein